MTHIPATEAQKAYIAKLGGCRDMGWSKASASAEIDRLLSGGRPTGDLTKAPGKTGPNTTAKWATKRYVG